MTVDGTSAAPGRLLKLTLTDFRNYAALSWHPAAGISVITGANGSGKTNLLEGVSLLAPGRGLRGARVADLPRVGGAGTWAVAGRVQGDDAPVLIGTGTQPEGASDRRVFRLDGAAPRNQSEIARHFAAVWLTPRMDRLFQDSASGRRRFLDRLVYALEPGHAREMAAHDTAVAGRNRLLSEGGRDPAWLDGLEDAIARHAVAATAARASLAARLNAVAAPGSFPAARISVLGPIAERLATAPALAAEDWVRAELAASRPTDRGGTRLGAHLADMELADATTGQPARMASTGQQKALLIGTVLAHAALIAQARGSAPILLLDEPLVHLDPARRAALFAALRILPAQVLLTGTDPEPFEPLRGHAEALVTQDGRLSPDAAFGL